MTPKERKTLREAAHNLQPAVMIGKNGLTQEVVNAAECALTASGLVKVRFIGFKDQRREISAQLAEKTLSEIVDIIGNVVIIYREIEED